MESQSPQYFYSQPSSYQQPFFTPLPNPLQSISNASNPLFQVERWANWVRFVSLYIIISSISGVLVDIVYLIILGPYDPDSVYTIEIELILLILRLIVGIIGYRASSKRTSLSAKVYVGSLFGLVAISALVIVSILNEVMYKECSKEAKRFEDGEVVCSRDDIFGISLGIGVVVLVIYLCLCSPVMFCACRLARWARGVEGNRQLGNRDIQMVTAPAGFQFGRSYPSGGYQV